MRVGGSAIRDGYTILELLIVMMISGILAVVLIPVLMNARGTAQERMFQAHSSNVFTVATAWLASDSSRTATAAANEWSPCLTAKSLDGYGVAAAPPGTTLCTVTEDGEDRIRVTVTGSVRGVSVTYVNGFKQ
jgi:prepilin-type N-terminal cleavage/methylation domain-containing protein